MCWFWLNKIFLSAAHLRIEEKKNALFIISVRLLLSADPLMGI